jgi:hypothetical protein
MAKGWNLTKYCSEFLFPRCYLKYPIPVIKNERLAPINPVLKCPSTLKPFTRIEAMFKENGLFI